MRLAAHPSMPSAEKPPPAGQPTAARPLGGTDGITARSHPLRGELFLFLCILAAAAALRFYQLSASSLWSDEGNSWALVGRSFAQITQDAAADIHPPGYYWALKLWAMLFGQTAAGLRSFSAVLGLLLVAMLWGVGRSLEQGYASVSGAWPSGPWGSGVGLLAAWVAALHPFLVYYSQEARMYMLLAVCAVALFWSLLVYLAAEEEPARRGSLRIAAAGYVAAAAAGLWTHYTFPVLLAAAVTAYLFRWWRRWSAEDGSGLPRPRLGAFLGLNLLVLLLFAPWLPIGWARVLAWPRVGDPLSLAESLRLTLQTFSVGPLRSAPAVGWPWLGLAALLPFWGLLRQRHRRGATAVALWLLAPVALIFGLGFVGDAVLKFLLTAAPAWALAVALAGAPSPVPVAQRLPLSARMGTLLPPLSIALGALALAAATLPAYYADPMARDNYAGVARYVAVLGDPAQDLVILNAPGQQEVWAYYDPGLPVLALPAERPPDPAHTLAALAAATADRRQIFALFWATEQADPGGLVEKWLAQQGFKGAESWQGNLRFVTYGLPNRLSCATPAGAQRLGDLVVLEQVCLGDAPVAAGEMALVALGWRASGPLDERYKVSVQLLDSRDQVVAQHDGEPAGGAAPTDGWQPGGQVMDNHGLLVPPGTPPGTYRLVVLFYHPQSGRRLPATAAGTTAAADHLPLGAVTVIRPAAPIPPAVVPMQRRLDAPLPGSITLLGYDRYRRGFGHAPETSLQPGDLLHVTLYWQAPRQGGSDLAEGDQLTLQLGAQWVTGPLAGGAYPLAQWTSLELVRGEFDIPYAGGSRALSLQVGPRRLSLGKIP